MTAVMYLSHEIGEPNHHIHFAYSLKYMIIEFFRHFKQPLEESTCPTVLIRQKSVYCLHPKCLMEEPPVQSPSITVRQENGIELESTP